MLFMAMEVLRKLPNARKPQIKTFVTQIDGTWLHLLALMILLLIIPTVAMEMGPSELTAQKVLSMTEASVDSIKIMSLDSVKAYKNIPIVTVSYAQTLDGSIAPLERTRLDISSKTSFRLLHSIRAKNDGVLIGINTLICDRPRLNVRNPLPGVRIPFEQPRPIVIDSQLKFLTLEDILLERPIVFTTCCEGSTRWEDALRKVREMNGDLVTCQKDEAGRCDLRDCLHTLCHDPRFRMQRVLVEGGAGIIQSVLEQQLAHFIVLTIRPCYFGGYRAMTRQLPQPLSIRDAVAASIGGDLVLFGLLDKDEGSCQWKGSSSIETMGAVDIGDCSGGGDCSRRSTRSSSINNSIISDRDGDVDGMSTSHDPLKYQGDVPGWSASRSRSSSASTTSGRSSTSSYLSTGPSILLRGMTERRRRIRFIPTGEDLYTTTVITSSSCSSSSTSSSSSDDAC